MHTRRARTARRAIAAIGASVAVAASGLALAPAAPAVAPGDTVIVNCVGKKVVKPREIVISCADAGISVQRITWRYWDDNRARGRGTLVWNTCLPTDCASGIVQRYRARIVLDRVASGPGLTVFSRMKLTFPNGGPAGLETGTMTLPNQGG